MAHLCPPLDPALIRWLDEKFPELSPRKGEQHADLMWRGGLREVVRTLKVELERQELTNVSPQKATQARHPS
jgi:hypothetical protein